MTSSGSPLAASSPRQRLRVAGWLLAVASAAAIAWLTLLPTPTSTATHPLCVICGPLAGVDALLNVALFVPLGVALALQDRRTLPAIALMCAFSVGIELLQFRWIAGRDASLMDIVTNTSGGALGFAAGRHASMLLWPASRRARGLLALWLVVWNAALTLVAFALVPAMPDPPYFGQIDRPASAAREAFPGQVLSARIGAEPLRPGLLPNADAIRAGLTLRSGSPLVVAVVPGGATSRRSEIVQVAARGEMALASLDQHGRDLHFAVRTGAEILRLRPLEYRLRDAFRGVSFRDTLTLTGEYARRGVTISVASRGRTVAGHQLIPRLSLGWVMFAPRYILLDGDATETVLGVFFLALLAAPAGYFLGAGIRSGRARSEVIQQAAVTVAALFAGVAVAPAAFGLSAAAPWEWGAVAAGALAGVLLARLLAAHAPPERAVSLSDTAQRGRSPAT